MDHDKNKQTITKSILAYIMIGFAIFAFGHSEWAYSSCVSGETKQEIIFPGLTDDIDATSFFNHLIQ